MWRDFVEPRRRDRWLERGTLRLRPGTGSPGKSARFNGADGRLVHIWLEAKGDRSVVSVTCEKLDGPDEVAATRALWRSRLDPLVERWSHGRRTERARRVLVPVTQRTPRPRRSRASRVLVVLLVAAVVGTSLGTLAIATNVLGAGDRWQGVLDRVERFVLGPVPDRPAPVTIRVTPPPVTPDPTDAPVTPAPASPDPAVSPTPEPTPTPAPVPGALDEAMTSDPEAAFASQVEKDWCSPAGVQMVLALHGLVDTSVATQREIAGRVREWESRADSKNGKWGPAAMALALEAYGAPGYEVRAFDTRAAALADSARAIDATNAPVILLTWRGAHTWVMSGYRADADPTVFADAVVSGTYILDPWFPRVSSIWDASDPAGTFQDGAEMERNYLPWKRPEGIYPDRDGLFITVTPTIPIPEQG